jgi:DNA-binding transcriptional LysR family regulator
MLKFGLRQLNHFVAIAEAGTYRGAAERLFIAQPALSISIHKLEASLGVRLFERGPRGVTLTLGGLAFLAEAKRSLLHAEQAQQRARLAVVGEWGTVRLGFVGSAVYQLLPRTLPGFIARHPGVTLDLHEGATVYLTDMVRDGRLDAGIIRTPVEDTAELDLFAVETDDLIAVLPAGHPLAKRKRIDLASLRDDAFVMFSKTLVPGLRAIIVEACRDAGFIPRVAQEATQALTVVGLVGSGLGVAIVPGVIARFVNPQVVFVRLSNQGAQGTLTLSIAMRNHDASAATRRLCHYIAAPSPP